jgi:hypothetical protein
MVARKKKFRAGLCGIQSRSAVRRHEERMCIEWRPLHDAPSCRGNAECVQVNAGAGSSVSV